MVVLAALAVTAALASAAPPTFTNPLFPGGDPWVTREDNVYYYSAANCDGHQSICLKSAPTLTGLIDAAWKVVWTPKNPSDPNGEEVWAPEIHKVDGHWFIYYCADPNGENNQHRIFVLRAASDDPLGMYVEADTGMPHGGLARVNDRWAIDPDVFTGLDGKLYLTWSCTNYPDSRFPQRICLARMKDPEHLDTNPLPISTPLEPWETRGAAIQEGPVGYVRDGRTYITYSASSSWLPDTYSVGLLTSESNDLLAPEHWSKSGPIFTNHGKTYGPGSVVFAPSTDGKQMWNFYHGIERLDCKPAYTCRDIRMQPMHFDEQGNPVLGVPFDPGVPIEDPSGEHGVSAAAAEILNPSWGEAWGDRAEGVAAGAVVGQWSGPGQAVGSLPPSSATLSTLADGWNQVFRQVNLPEPNYSIHTDVQLQPSAAAASQPAAAGPPANTPGRDAADQEAGLYCLYQDEKNHAEAVINLARHSLSTHAVVGGVEQPWRDVPLPPGFDPSAVHHLECNKVADSFTFWLDRLSGSGVLAGRHFDLRSGQFGLLAKGTGATYSGIGTN